MTWNCCLSAIIVAKLLMGTLLSDFNKTKFSQNPYNIFSC